MGDFLAPLWLSVKLASLTTFVLLSAGLLLVYCLHMLSFRGKSLLRALTSLPLVLPPTVIGYYLLVAFQPAGSLGKILEQWMGLRLVFSFPGILIGSIIFSLPFMVSPVLAGLEALPRSLMEASFTLGKTRWSTFWRVLLPNVRPSIIGACVLTFAHTMGEFGVVLMIGGNIPGETRVASIAIFHEMEAMNYSLANRYSLLLLIFSLLVIGWVQWLQKRIALW